MAITRCHFKSLKGYSFCCFLRRAGALCDVDRHFERQADPQGILGRQRPVQLYFHRHTLNDLDPVSGGVLRREEGKGRSCAGADSEYSSVIDIARIDIGFHESGLPRPHLFQLAKDSTENTGGSMPFMPPALPRPTTR